MSGIALYLLAQEYRDSAAILADMDVDPRTAADTLEGMAGDLEVKAQAVAYVVRSLEAEAATIKAWAATAVERAKAAEARADSMREYLRHNLEACGIQKITGPGIAIGWRKSSAVVIDEPGLVPAEFMRTPEPPPPAPDKAAIKAAITAGSAVPGAHIEHRSNLTIK